MKYSAKMAARDIAECGLFAALMVAGAFIQIPCQPVPLTFQTVISVLCGIMLGWKKGMISMGVYMLMGLIGIPVFAAGGGIFYVLKPSFGYVIGFIAAAGVAGAIVNKSNPSTLRLVIAAVSGFLADYVVGIPYCMVAAYLLNVPDLTALLVTGNLIYMPKDVALCVGAGLISRGIFAAMGTKLRKPTPEKNKTEE